MITVTKEMAEKGGVCPICGRFFKPNGVGGEGDILTPIIDNLPSSSVLRFGCNFHDWFFHLGNNWGTREQADKMMYELNEKQISLKCKWWNAWYYRIMNYRNYIAVRKFGHRFWDKDGCGL